MLSHICTHQLVRGLAGGSRLDVFLLASELLQEPELSGVEFTADFRPRERYVANIMELTACLPLLGLPDDATLLRYLPSPFVPVPFG
jgi:hypothetical protein